MKLLLDTCTFLWWATADREPLSLAARQALSEGGHDAFLSTISVWEIGQKHALGRLKLNRSVAQFIADGRARHRVETLPFDESAALTHARLPSIHRDPFDRMLICQAIVNGLTIVTPDPLIHQYAVSTLW